MATTNKAGTDTQNRATGRVSRRWPRYRHSSIFAGCVVVLLALFGWMLSFATREPGSRIARPGVEGFPQSVRPPFGFSGWAYVFEFAAIGSFVFFGAILVVHAWERREMTMALMFFLAGNALVWLDPWGNWGPYAIYTPELLHWPETWWWASISPTVEPVFNFIGYFAFYIGPPALAILVQKKLIGPRVSSQSFVHRHPLITLTILTVVLGFIIDATIELTFIKTGMYGFSQVPPFGSINVGRPDQFPLLWQSLGTTFPFIACALLWWRNDTGLTGAERLANRWRATRKSGRLGVFVTMFVVMSFGYFLYLAPFFVIRYFDLATSIARPWRWCATQVYDPQGHYEKAGEQGPFYAGPWSGWMSGQPDGRHVEPPVGEPLPNSCPP